MRQSRREAMLETLGRACVGVLFVLLSISLLEDFLRTHHLTGLLLLVSEALVVVFTIVRRPAHTIDRTTTARVVTVLALLGPPLLRTSTGPPIVGDGITALVSAVGISLVIVGKLTLGRSFGIVPANRGVVVKGPYSFVRHPIYAGYLISHVAFIAAHPTGWNVAVIVAGDAALIVRALFEERILQRDEEYRAYCGRVSWHLVPGVF